MKNPYKVLQVLPSATDNEIKGAYIQLVKKYSPDRFPEKFKEIRKAYETISTPKNRVAHRLFSIEELDPQHLVEGFLSHTTEERNRISPKQLIEIIIKKFQKSNILRQNL